ncbi:hypothetical protein HDU96_010768 [Phlyctochytrium bullatum]|nr:hypothetical protein HDU96_010768 [Phlyctochytrium bullatum]
MARVGVVFFIFAWVDGLAANFVLITVELRHFNLLRCVGKGAFGKVRIVEKRDTKKLYALKYINKLQCIRMRAIQNIFRERAILEEINHPFVVNLRFAFQDDENMFMVLDLMMGGDLRYHLDRLGGFPEAAARLMAAEMSTAIAYLHSKSIVHRDLKPDNVLLDEDGHAHLTDFNIAVNFSQRKYLKSHSGTHSYMAPEIFRDQGYLWQIDWWSLGILIYELLYGKRPFRGPNNDAVTQSILTEELVFPPVNLVHRQPVPLSPECHDFILRLLDRDPHRRLGCGPAGAEEVFAHPWFSGLDWTAVEAKSLRPVFVPDKDRPNFDATYDLEELLLEDNPLSYRPRKKKTTRNAHLAAAAQAHMNIAPGGGKSGSTGSLQVTPNTSDNGHNNGGGHGGLTPAHHRSMNNLTNGANRSTPRIPPPNLDAAAPNGGGSGSPGGSMHAAAGAGGPGANVPLPPSVANTHAYNQLGQKERIALDLQFIEDHFRSFDSTVYERYPGIIDPKTLRVGDPPPWVTEAGTPGAPGLGGSGGVPPVPALPQPAAARGPQPPQQQAFNFDGDPQPRGLHPHPHHPHRSTTHLRKAPSGGGLADRATGVASPSSPLAMHAHNNPPPPPPTPGGGGRGPPPQGGGFTYPHPIASSPSPLSASSNPSTSHLAYINPLGGDMAFAGLSSSAAPPTRQPKKPVPAPDTPPASQSSGLSFASKLVRRVSRSGSAPPAPPTTLATSAPALDAAQHHFASPVSAGSRTPTSASMPALAAVAAPVPPVPKLPSQAASLQPIHPHPNYTPPPPPPSMRSRSRSVGPADGSSSSGGGGSPTPPGGARLTPSPTPPTSGAYARVLPHLAEAGPMGMRPPSPPGSPGRPRNGSAPAPPKGGPQQAYPSPPSSVTGGAGAYSGMSKAVFGNNGGVGGVVVQTGVGGGIVPMPTQVGPGGSGGVGGVRQGRR